MENRRASGNVYENAVVDFLKKRKYKIIKKNYYTKSGEVDIIAKDGNVITFIEVKAREAKSNINPFEAVDKYKQKKIINAAKSYLLKNNLFNSFIRFDVAGVIIDDGKIKNIEIIKDAFQDES